MTPSAERLEKTARTPPCAGCARFALVAGVIVFSSVSRAATNVWVGLGGNVNWSTPGNWTNGVVPVGASGLVVQLAGNLNMGTAAVPLNQDLSDPLSLTRLATVNVLGSGDQAVYVGGGRLNFVTTGAVQPTLLHDRDHVLSVKAPVSFPAGVTLAITNRTQSVDFEGPLSGAGGFSFWSGSAGGEMSLKNTANSYSGGTAYINTYGANAQYARLYVYATQAFGTGPVTLNGGNLAALGSGNQQAGGLTFLGTTTQTNDFKLQASSPIFAGMGVTNESVAAASVTLSGAFDLDAYTLYLRGQRNTSGTLAGVISRGGTNALVKMDLGVWTLSGANSYTGSTRLASGVLSVGLLANGGAVSGVGASSNAAANLVFAGGTLRYTGATATTDRRFTVASGKNAIFDVAQPGATLTFASILGSAGIASGTTLTKSGPGTLTFGYDGPGGSGGAYLGTIDGLVINEGSFLTVTGDKAQINVSRQAANGPALVLGDGVLLGCSVPLDVTASNTEQVIRYIGTNVAATVTAGLFSGPGNGGSNTKTFDVNDGAADIDLLVSANFAIYSGVANPAVSDILKTGAGTLKLSGTASQFQGTTTVRNGRLVVGANVPCGGNSVLGNATSMVQVADAGTASSNTVALVFDGHYTFGRGICVFPYPGGASVTVGSVATNSAVFAGPILLSNTVQLTSASTGTNAVFVTGGISGPGGITLTGTGAVVLAADNLYTGLTTVTAGTLRLAAADRIADVCGLRMTGGFFDTAGYSETLGELDVDGAAAIDLGNGGSVLRFADSSSQTWSGTLTVHNWTSLDGGGAGRLFVGTSNKGLTAAQLAKIIRPDGRKVAQLATGEVVPASVIYVASNGNDAWSGALEQPNVQGTDGPLSSLEGARKAVRTLRSQPGGAAWPVCVEIGDGTYALTTPLALGLSDSGGPTNPIAYQAASGAHPVFSGGRRIHGWTRGSGGLWVAFLPGVASGADYFEQLFIDGRRAQRARSPNSNYYFTRNTVPSQSNLCFVAFGSDVASLHALSGQEVSDATVVVYHKWETSRHRLVSIDDGETLTFTNRAPWAFSSGQRYQIENIAAALDEPGEWFLARNGMLSYWPLPGEDMNTAEVIAPVNESFIEITGDSANGLFVQNLTFQGLSFQHGQYVLPARGHAVNQAESDLPAAITLNGARNVSFLDCELSHIGRHGIRFQRGCRDCLVSRCYLNDLGAGGIYIGETTQRASTNDRTSFICVDNTIIRAGGRIHAGAIGAWIGQSADNSVTHNDISDFFYSGVSVGWTWGYGSSLAVRNHIDGNHIHDIGWGVLSDMGAVYTLGISPGTTVSQNYVHHIYSYSYGGWGLYNDEGSSGILLASNLVHDAKSGGYHQHYGETNTVRNNIFAHGVTAELQRSRPETNHVSFVFENNIVYWGSGTLLYSQWADTDFFVMRSNLYWQVSGTNISFAGNSFSQWQALGEDLGSSIADPLFKDGMNRDFRLSSASAVDSVGFQPFDFTAAGVYGDPGWLAKARVPSQPASLPQPVSYSPFDYNEDFEGLGIGAPPPFASVYGTGGGASLGVVSNVPSFGMQCLALTDAPGLSQTFYPFFNYAPPDLTGNLNYSFSLRLAADAKMYHEWRDYPGGSYVSGPSLGFDQCQLKVGGVTLASVPSNQWLRVDVLCCTTNYASQGWKLGLTIPGQATRWFANLHTGSTGWSRLNWLGWISEATNDTTFYLDNLTMTNLPVFLQAPTPPAPVISGLADLTLAEGSSTGPISFTVTDAEVPADGLDLSVSSSNSRLLPARNISIGGSGTNWTITLTPSLEETGFSTIQVTASDGLFHATASFLLTVTSTGGDPLRSIELTSPKNDFTNALSVLVAAAADDPDGTLTRIDFLADGQLLGQTSLAPFALYWTNLLHGTHTLVAIGYDMTGHSVTSAPVRFTNFLPPLTALLIPGGATWRYFDRTNDLGTAWRTSSFSDTTWKSGPAMLGFGDANGLLPSTTVANNLQWTTYFRRAFVVPVPGSINDLNVRLLRDDGAVVYLNGAEVWRDNLPGGVIGNATPASASIDGAAESQWLTNSISPSLLVPGTNLIAVEIHQRSLSSSDITFDFECRATALLAAEPMLNADSTGSALALSWPASDPGAFYLYGATNLISPVVWTRLTNAPVFGSGVWKVEVPVENGGSGFFRLQTLGE